MVIIRIIEMISQPPDIICIKLASGDIIYAAASPPSQPVGVCKVASKLMYKLTVTKPQLA